MRGGRRGTSEVLLQLLQLARQVGLALLQLRHRRLASGRRQASVRSRQRYAS